jgi:hypothetical protein
MSRYAVLLLVLVAGLPAAAQQSASFRLEEHVTNAGGRPEQGTIAQSASFQIRLDAIGDGVNLAGLASASFGMDAGFVMPYPPPEEVTGVLFTTHEKMIWDPEKSTGTYSVYRGLISSLSGLVYGSCLAPGIVEETTDDAVVPDPDTGFFYLITAENLLAQEGTKGFRSGGAERANAFPCQ